MTNFRNNWRGMLDRTNEELKPSGYELRIYIEEDGYNLDIFKDGEHESNFASGYYEDELEGLIQEAKQWVCDLNKIEQEIKLAKSNTDKSEEYLNGYVDALKFVKTKILQQCHENF